jgi:hypothetical protein
MIVGRASQVRKMIPAGWLLAGDGLPRIGRWPATDEAAGADGDDRTRITVGDHRRTIIRRRSSGDGDHPMMAIIPRQSSDDDHPVTIAG